MSTEGNALYAKDLFLLTLKGQIIVHFLDGNTLGGEYVTQDMLNIFVRVDDEPVMIPRSQIRYLKGAQDQQVEKDDTQADFLDMGITLTASETKELEPLAPDVAEQGEPDATFILADAAEEIAAAPEAVISEERVFSAQDVGIEFAEDEDPTLVFEEESEIDEAEEEATFVLHEEETPARETTAYLECISGPHSGEVFALTSGDTTLGRSSDNTVALTNDKEISRKHSRITYEAGSYHIEDLNSLNGTFVNNDRIADRHDLGDSDVILIGVSGLVFHQE
jgi:hypothetical protein